LRITDLSHREAFLGAEQASPVREQLAHRHQVLASRRKLWPVIDDTPIKVEVPLLDQERQCEGGNTFGYREYRADSVLCRAWPAQEIEDFLTPPVGAQPSRVFGILSQESLKNPSNRLKALAHVTACFPIARRQLVHPLLHLDITFLSSSVKHCWDNAVKHFV
jgi:hypothetical protein